MESDPPATEAEVLTRPFGTASTGAPARLVTLRGDAGITVRVTDFGATLVEVHVPDRRGELTDVTLGFDDVAGYGSAADAYLGATVGRVANRIAGACFTLDGHDYRVAANEPPNAIHGGPERSLSRVMWNLVAADDDEAELTYTSPDGEEGYPGTLEVSARYRLVGRELEVHYRAVTDRRTPVNLTNHAYWNLSGAGDGTVLDHLLMIAAERYTPTDTELIPTGEIAAVTDTPLDFRELTRIGDRIGLLEATAAAGFDHNYVIAGDPGRVRFAARLYDPGSGRILELHTDQPGVQFYSGNRLSALRGKGARRYGRNAGLCLEPQHHPDAVHRPEFPSIVLDPGRTYEHVSRYVFGVDDG